MRGLLKDGRGQLLPGGLAAMEGCTSQCCGPAQRCYLLYNACDATFAVCAPLTDEYIAVPKDRVGGTGSAFGDDCWIVRWRGRCYHYSSGGQCYSIPGEGTHAPIPAGVMVVPDGETIDCGVGGEGCDWEGCDSHNSVLKMEPCPNQPGVPPAYLCHYTLLPGPGTIGFGGYCYAVDPIGGEIVDVDDIPPGAVVIDYEGAPYVEGGTCCDCVEDCERTEVSSPLNECRPFTPPPPPAEPFVFCCCVELLSMFRVQQFRIESQLLHDAPTFHNRVLEIFNPLGGDITGVCTQLAPVRWRLTSSVQGVSEGDGSISVSCAPGPDILVQGLPNGFFGGSMSSYFNICLENSVNEPGQTWAESFDFHRDCCGWKLQAKWNANEDGLPLQVRFWNAVDISIRIEPGGNCATPCGGEPAMLVGESTISHRRSGCSGCGNGNLTGGATI